MAKTWDRLLSEIPAGSGNKVYIYHGRDVYIPQASCNIQNGQLLYISKTSERQLWGYRQTVNYHYEIYITVYDNGRENTPAFFAGRCWEMNRILDGLFTLSEFNAKMYGSKCRHRTGSKYSIRAGLCDGLFNSSGNRIVFFPTPSAYRYKVAFDGGQGSLEASIGAWYETFSRCDGYYFDNVFHETSGLYAATNFHDRITQYGINTY